MTNTDELTRWTATRAELIDAFTRWNTDRANHPEDYASLDDLDPTLQADHLLHLLANP